MQTFDDNPPSRIGSAGAARNRRWWTLTAVCTGVFMLLLDITIVNVALPDIENTFGASLSELQWVISASWTHLLAGMIVCGIGGGLVSTPLISTAVGVVEPARAGMASGINSTLRQVGIATGVATLGTILVSHVHSSVLAGLRGTPLAGHAPAIAHAVSTGGGADAIASTPPPLRGLMAFTARSALVQGLNTIMLISAVVAFAAAVASFVLIRERDFVTLDEGEEEELELAVAA